MQNAIRTEWESIKQKEEQKRLERESKIAEEKRLQESWFEQLNAYANSTDEEDPPSFLLNLPATSSEPSGEPCPFFSKTGMCRFGSVCSRYVNSFYIHFNTQNYNYLFQVSSVHIL